MSATVLDLTQVLLNVSARVLARSYSGVDECSNRVLIFLLEC